MANKKKHAYPLPANFKSYYSFWGVVLVFMLLAAVGANVLFHLYWIKNDYMMILCIVLDAILLIAFIGFLILRYCSKKKLKSDVLEAALSMEREYKQTIAGWDDALGFFNEHNELIWANNKFKSLFPSIPDPTEMTPEVLGLPIKLAETEVDENGMRPRLELGDKIYEYWVRYVAIKPTKRGAAYNVAMPKADAPSLTCQGKDYNSFMALSLRDVSYECSLEQDNSDLRPRVCYLDVDNYEQVMETMDEEHKPLLDAVLYRALFRQAENLDGVLIQTEKNSFTIVFHNKYMPSLIESHFSVLDDVRALENGNTYPMTLSIGLGAGDTLDESKQLAREALRLALSRGGDQAVVMQGAEIKFYGGKSSAVESNNRVRSRFVAQSLRDIITNVDRVVVAGHVNPDFDSFGSALGILCMCRKLDKPAHIILEEPLQGIEQLLDDYRELDIASRTLISSQTALDYMKNEVVLLVVVDTSQPALLPNEKLTEKASVMAVIDHHRSGVERISPVQLSYVEPASSSTSEQVTELLQYAFNKCELESYEADALLAGIVLDTKSFSVQCGVRTFEAAAYLRRQGANTMRVRKLFELSLEELQAKSTLLKEIEKVDDGVYMACWKSDLPSAGILAAQCADQILELEEVHASLVLTEHNGRVNLSARSDGSLNVQMLAEKVGGGGRRQTAGSLMKNTTLEEAKAMVLQAWQEVKEN